MYEIETATEYETERLKPMPSLNHSIIQANLILELGAKYRKKYRIASELSLDLADWPSVLDICIYPKRPLDLQNDQTEVTEPPLCTIEILSLSQSFTELMNKARNYFKYGVQSCWIVLLPLGNIYVFRSPEDYDIFRPTETLHDRVLDVSLPLPEVFE